MIAADPLLGWPITAIDGTHHFRSETSVMRAIRTGQADQPSAQLKSQSFYGGPIQVGWNTGAGQLARPTGARETHRFAHVTQVKHSGLQASKNQCMIWRGRRVVNRV